MTETTEPLPPNRPSRSGLARLGWSALGIAAVGLGGVGIIVPGLPTTVFFIIAAWAFSKSSPKMEAWVLGLPRIGPMVVDYRAGLGMPRTSKRMATAMIVLFVGLSAWLVDGWPVRLSVIGLALVGIAYIWFRVPTTEQVLLERERP